MQVVSLRVITINETGCKFRDSGTVRSRSCLPAIIVDHPGRADPRSPRTAEISRAAVDPA
jgi:hypothetical protein